MIFGIFLGPNELFVIERYLYEEVRLYVHFIEHP